MKTYDSNISKDEKGNMRVKYSNTHILYIYIYTPVNMCGFVVAYVF